MFHLLVVTAATAAATSCTATIVTITADLTDSHTNAFVHLDPSNSNVTTIRKPFAAWHTNEGAFDVSRNELYISTRLSASSALSIVKYDGITGAVASTAALADESIRSLYAVHYDSHLRQLVCILEHNETVAVGLLHPRNGTSTRIASLDDFVPSPRLYEFEVGASAYDQNGHAMHQLLIAPPNAKGAPPGGGHVLWRSSLREPGEGSLTPVSLLTPYDLLTATVSWNGALYGLLQNFTIVRIVVATGATELVSSVPVLSPPVQNPQVPRHATLCGERMLFTVTPMLPKRTYPQGSLLVSVSLHDGSATAVPVEAPLMFAHALSTP